MAFFLIYIGALVINVMSVGISIFAYNICILIIVQNISSVLAIDKLTRSLNTQFYGVLMKLKYLTLTASSFN